MSERLGIRDLCSGIRDREFVTREFVTRRNVHHRSKHTRSEQYSGPLIDFANEIPNLIRTISPVTATPCPHPAKPG